MQQVTYFYLEFFTPEWQEMFDQWPHGKVLNTKHDVVVVFIISHFTAGKGCRGKWTTDNHGVQCTLTLKLPITTIVVCFVICLWF